MGNSVSNNQPKKKPNQQIVFATAGLVFDISQNCHKLEITSKHGMEALVFPKYHNRFSFLSSHQHQPTGYFENTTWPDTITVAANPKERISKPKLKSIMFLNIQVNSSTYLIHYYSIHLLNHSGYWAWESCTMTYTITSKRREKNRTKEKKTHLQCARAGGRCVLSNIWTVSCNNSRRNSVPDNILTTLLAHAQNF